MNDICMNELYLIFIGPKSDLCLPLSLTHSCLVDLMPVYDANCFMILQRLLKGAHSSKIL